MSVGEFNTQQKVLKEGRRVLPHINSFTNAPLANIYKVILLTKWERLALHTYVSCSFSCEMEKSDAYTLSLIH